MVSKIFETERQFTLNSNIKLKKGINREKVLLFDLGELSNYLEFISRWSRKAIYSRLINSYQMLSKNSFFTNADKIHQRLHPSK